MDAIPLQGFIDWVGHHGAWAGAFIFLITLAGSLVVVGMFIHTGLLLFGAGALVAAGALDLGTTLGLAFAGTVSGDALSFWIGHHFQDRLRYVWPFRRHPEWLLRGETFFRRHAGKSTLLGRFVGPVVPATAGMMGLPPLRFFVVDVPAALLWVAAFILPGMVLAASLELAADVAPRLLVLLALVVGLLWLTFWLVRRLFALLQPRAAAMLDCVLAWSRGRRIVGWLTAALTDLRQPESRGLLTLGVVLLVAAAAFFAILEGVATGNSLVRIDSAVYHIMQGLRTPWGDRAMVAVTNLGDTAVIWTVVTMVLAWLLWRRCWGAAAHWLATGVFGGLLTWTLKTVLKIPRPLTGYQDGLSAYAFPSGHATMSMAVYGFLAVLIARELPPAQRRWPYSVAGLLIVSIAFSRLYLGVHWLSDVLGGLSFALAWVALLGIAYGRRVLTRLPLSGLLLTGLGGLFIAGSWQLYHQYSGDLARYAPRHHVRSMQTASWWEREWRLLPAYRADLGGGFEQPFTVQWAGGLDRLRAQLHAQGWRAPTQVSLANSLHWFAADTKLADLPVLPQVHDGRHESFLMVYTIVHRVRIQTGDDVAEAQLVLRLWPADAILTDKQTSLWVGYVAIQRRVRIPPFLWVLRTANELDQPITMLQSLLKGVHWKRVYRMPAENQADIQWSGAVLLIQEPIDYLARKYELNKILSVLSNSDGAATRLTTERAFLHYLSTLKSPNLQGTDWRPQGVPKAG
ncbi:MAG: phosphatase PAP2 family protein [Acidiferrobacterales bacterium]